MKFSDEDRVVGANTVESVHSKGWYGQHSRIDMVDQHGSGDQFEPAS